MSTNQEDHSCIKQSLVSYVKKDRFVIEIAENVKAVTSLCKGVSKSASPSSMIVSSGTLFNITCTSPKILYHSYNEILDAVRLSLEWLSMSEELVDRTIWLKLLLR